MSSSLDRLDIAVCAVVVVAIVVIYLNQRRNRYPYPPGPKGLPILGNVLDIPEQRQWLAYARWGRESGEWQTSCLTMTTPHKNPERLSNYPIERAGNIHNCCQRFENSC